jgi:HEAT repeat protein
MWVRYHTISAIGDLGQKEHARYVLPYLNDDLDIIKIAAIKALAGMGIREAVPDLDRLTREKNQDVVDAARQALSSMGDN